jgi:hypothetical protein
MKTVYNKIPGNIIIFFFLIIISYSANGQVTPEDPTNLVQEFTVNIDKLGDANMDLTQKMTASQWESFKQAPIFNDPSMAKRDMERSMATYVVEDFKRDVDEMNRSVKLSLKVKSYAQYKGNGHWSFKIDSKNPQVTKLTDNAYMITGNAAIGSALVQQIFKINFPSSASNVTQTTDEFGKAIFTYDAGSGFTSYLTWNNMVGILFILAAVFFLIKPWPSPKQKYNAVTV